FELPRERGAAPPPRRALGAGAAPDLRFRSPLRGVLPPVGIGLGLPPPGWARPAAHAPRTPRPVPPVVHPPLMRGNGLSHRSPFRWDPIALVGMAARRGYFCANMRRIRPNVFATPECDGSWWIRQYVRM